MRDPYVYDNSDVLINKANLKDKQKLDEFENRMTTLSLITIFKTDRNIMDVKDLYEIHRLLFENVYEWAGKPREINIYKNEPVINGLSVVYSDHNDINHTLSETNKTFLGSNWENYSKEDFIHLFTRMISKIWQIHPFREGNTRVVSTFAFLFLKQYGYTFDVAVISKNAKYFRNALVMASLGEYAEYNYLQNILLDAINGSKNNSNPTKYQKIRDYDVNQYEYVYHKLKK